MTERIFGTYKPLTKTKRRRRLTTSEYLSANSENKWGKQQCEEKDGLPPELLAEWPKYDTASRLVRTEPPRTVGETLGQPAS